MISLTVFSSVYDNKTDVRVDFENFEQFEKSLYHLSTLPGYKPKKGEYLKGKTPSPLISPAVYKNGTTRANANVTEWAGWAALDIDNHEFKGNLKDELHSHYGNWYYICYSTASSTPDHPKFRLVFPLTDSINANNIKHFWYALNTEFGQLGDAQTKDLSRMFFIPGQYPNAYNFIFTNQGNPINPSELMKSHPWTAPNDSTNFLDRLPPELQKEVVLHRQAKLNGERRNYEWHGYKDCPFVNKRLVDEYKSIARIDGSGRYSAIYKLMTSIACNAVKKKYPITEYEIVNLIRELDRETSNRYAKRPLNVEASRAIEFAWKHI